VTLVVNVASYCGYTPQYKGLEALHRELKDKGFAVLGFPSNDFGEQEPGTAEEIATFCKRTYDVTFPMFSKVVTRPAVNSRRVSVSRNERPFAAVELREVRGRQRTAVCSRSFRARSHR
jgi:glutathione peroxidase